MSPVVVDCSVSAAWLLDEHGASVSSVLDAIALRRALVPALWRIEIANVMRSAMRRGRIGEAHARRALGLLQQAPIDVDDALPSPAALFDLAQRHGLSAYDACYLELAMRRGLALATLDADLKRAAIAAGCVVL